MIAMERRGSAASPNRVHRRISERVGFDDESKTLADVMAIARRQQTQQNDQVRSKIIRRRYIGS